MTDNLSGYFGSNNEVEITPNTSTNTWAGNIYYITGIILPPGRKFNIRVPNGEGKNLVGFNFSVNAETKETTIIEDTTT